MGGRVVYLAKSPGEHGLGIDFEAGVSLPAHTLATGKVPLAYTTREEREELYEEGLAAYAKATITDPAALEAELATILAQGYALDRGERFEDYRGMAVPILGADGRPVLGMACVADRDTMKLTDAYVTWLSQVMRPLALEMTDQLVVLGDMPKVNIEAARFNLE